jgi:hypothetical protein
LVNALDAKLTTKIDAQASELFTVNQKIDSLTKRLSDMSTANRSLTDDIERLSREKADLQLSLETLEQYTRNDSLLIHGVALPPSGAPPENLYHEIPDLLNRLIPAVQLTSSMISVAHRLPSANTPSNGASSLRTPRPPPIVVRFTHKSTRIALIANRKLLKGKTVVLTEHLTPSRAALLKKANALVTSQKLTSAWSQDGKILVRTASNRTVHILKEDDLAQFQ